jgi:7-cyano-7-deazaguanine synthase in queuosine biosynthesis
VGDNTLPELEQVKSGILDAYKYAKTEVMYVGVISNRDEHLIGYDKTTVIETENLRFPFQHLEKSHVVDIYYKLGLEYLLTYTHSCDHNEHTHCWNCNGCNERIWAFSQLNKKDPKRI